MNGGMRVAQRGTSFTVADATPTLDRWTALAQAGTPTVAQSTTTPAGFGTSLSIVTGTSDQKVGVVQHIENMQCEWLEGQVVTLSFWARNNGTTVAALRAGLAYWTSTVDQPTRDLVSGWPVAGANPSLVANFTFANAPSTLAISAVWTRFSIGSISLPAAFANLAVLIWTDDDTIAAGEGFFVTGVELVRGASPTDYYRHGSFLAELMDCRHFYQKTFPYATAPAQNAGVEGALVAQGYAGNVAANEIAWIAPWQHVPELRAVPTITTYNPQAANAFARNIDGAADKFVTVVQDTRQSYFYDDDTAASGDNRDRIAVHAQAEAEF
jgi:hypothetical protein